jgi:phosphatidylserine decarboxylase
MSEERRKATLRRVVFGVGLLLLLASVVLLRLAFATDYAYHALVKDPERTIPSGRVIVAPADGTVLYVERVVDGTAAQIVKRGVSVPLEEHFKTEPGRKLGSGWLIGIYMNTQGVHVNRVPNHGKILEQRIYNGPHMNMSKAEVDVITKQLLPGRVALRKALGMSPWEIEDDADFVLKSARETLVMEDERGAKLYVVRIADFYVGRILTWVAEGANVERGARLGMITWGSQTDLFIEDSTGLTVTANTGEYVYGGQSVVATY